MPARRIQQKIRVQAALARKPARELGIRQRIKQSDHADRNGGLLDEFDDGIGDRSSFAVKAENETRRHIESGRINPMDALGNVPPRILLFPHRNQRVGSGLSMPTKTPMKLASFKSLMSSASSARLSEASVVNSKG